jgi:hypothetical protein
LAVALDPEDLSRFLVFPESSLLKRPVEFDRAGNWTFVYASPAIPAFVRMQYDGRFALFPIRNIDIYRTDFNASIAAVAFFRIKNHRFAWSDYVRKSEYFFFCHGSLLFYL